MTDSRAPSGAALRFVRLRVRGLDIDLGPGEHLVGRSLESAVRIDDPLASRKHARIVVSDEAVTIEDLGSRHGVLVNGERLAAIRALVQGDVVGIASQTFRVHRLYSDSSLPTTPKRASSPQALSFDDAMFVATTLSHAPSTGARRIEAFEILSARAESAATEGRPRDAEQILERALQEVLATLRCGILVESELVDVAARAAVMLAGAARSSFWMDYVFDLYTARRVPMPPDVLDKVDAGTVLPSDAAAVQVYASTLRASDGSSALVIATCQRLDALARRVSGR